MSVSVYAKGFRELTVYQKSRLLSRELYMHTKFFPKDEMHSLTNQIRQSSRSMGANIADAWAHRRNELVFIDRLTDADGEQMETQHWIEIACDCGYIDQDAGVQLVKRCAEIGRILNGMIDKSKMFCDTTRTLGEETTEYFIGSTSWSLPVSNEQME